MIYAEHEDAASFLAIAREALERHEAANGLMLGVCERLVEEPDAYGTPPYLATVGAGGDLCVAAVMTPPYNVQVFQPEGADRRGLELVADALLRSRRSVPGVIGRTSTAEAFAAVWTGRTGAACRTTMRQGIYELRRVDEPPCPAGRLVQATADHAALVREWAGRFHEDCFHNEECERSLRIADAKLESGDVFIWVDGVPRAMAARTHGTANGQAISFVYTPPEHRRKGYATALVACLSQLAMGSGKKFCTLYTDLDNPTSNSIYQKIGYRQVADSVDICFEDAAQR